MEPACLTAMRHLNDIEAWSARVKTEMLTLSGRTPPALRAVFIEWPFVSATMAEAHWQHPKAITRVHGVVSPVTRALSLWTARSICSAVTEGRTRTLATLSDLEQGSVSCRKVKKTGKVEPTFLRFGGRAFDRGA